MANPHKGEVEFTVAKTLYTLKFSMNAMCALEEALGRTIVEIGSTLSDPARMSMNTMRLLFWCGLRDFHSQLTQEDAGKLMDELGLTEAMELTAKAFTLAFPEAKQVVPLDRGKAKASGGKAY